MSLQFLLSNFALILFILVVVTGMIWLVDIGVLSKRRKKAAKVALAAFDERQAKLKAEGIEPDTRDRAALKASLLKQPVWVEYTGSFFPVILLVFCFRSFLYEPFKIPSSSMLPTLFVGDLILVNKFTYGIRLPIINKKVIEINRPMRGDVIVFKYPKDPSVDYIKRVVGLPGDQISYKNKRLTINGQPLVYEALPDFLETDRLAYQKRYQENLLGVTHQILNNDEVPTYVQGEHHFQYEELCVYDIEGVSCLVPQGHYFVMGDNRDNSLDSRYWGFVPDENIVGHAFGIWMNQKILTDFDFSQFKRLGGFQ